MSVRVRIAPSPTGVPHIGTTRTALFNYLFAKHNKGKFILRIEDTDRERLIPESLPQIYKILDVLGLKPDEGPQTGGAYGPYIQSERLAIYQEFAKKLVDRGNAYFCFCEKDRLEKMRQYQQKKGLPPKYDRHCLALAKTEINKKIIEKLPHVIRMKIPEGETFWIDLIHGKISFKSQLLDDQILLKSDGWPTYHLAVVVDDYLMKITHVLRGDEWISSTPKHLILYKFFGWNPPNFAHLPLILGPDGAKLSKRHGAKSVLEYAEDGYLPEAINNFMAFLGWSPKTNQEIFSLGQLIEKFDLAGINPTSPIFNIEKLRWFNGQWIRRLENEDLAKRIKQLFPEYSFEKIKSLILLVKERMSTLLDFKKIASFFFGLPTQFTPVQTPDTTIDSLATVYEKMPEWTPTAISAGTITFSGNNNLEKKDLFMDIRRIISGSSVTPPLFESLEKLGQDEVVDRLRKYVGKKKK